MRTIFLVLILCIFSAGVFAQEVTQPVKIDEFGAIYCCDFGARIDNAYIGQRANPGSKIYFIYYEGKKVSYQRWNKKLDRSETALRNPARGGFRDLLTGIRREVLFLKRDMNNIVVKHGGFRELRVVEVWIVPAGAAEPTATPTIDGKSVIYRKGLESNFSRLCDDM